MEEKRIKVLTLGDMPLSTSGVGSQSKYVIEALLKSGKFEVFSLLHAMRSPKFLSIVHFSEELLPLSTPLLVNGACTMPSCLPAFFRRVQIINEK